MIHPDLLRADSLERIALLFQIRSGDSDRLLLNLFDDHVVGNIIGLLQAKIRKGKPILQTSNPDLRKGPRQPPPGQRPDLRGQIFFNRVTTAHYPLRRSKCRATLLVAKCGPPEISLGYMFKLFNPRSKRIRNLPRRIFTRKTYLCIKLVLLPIILPLVHLAVGQLHPLDSLSLVCPPRMK